ncbi:hypothetical protein JCM33374_g4691 [Metschnikowia sp. JCM 33374]|nr:hypothetical protein JCM33374_g4691 [Metschnikowia sp. JCM 33374]
MATFPSQVTKSPTQLVYSAAALVSTVISSYVRTPPTDPVKEPMPIDPEGAVLSALVYVDMKFCFQIVGTVIKAPLEVMVTHTVVGLAETDEDEVGVDEDFVVVVVPAARPSMKSARSWSKAKSFISGYYSAQSMDDVSRVRCFWVVLWFCFLWSGQSET